MNRTHERQWALLHNAWRAGRLSHAYLFSGNNAVLQESYALRLARLVVCENPTKAPCEQCPACKSVLNNAHPDVFVVEPSDKEDSYDLTVSAVRALKDSMSKKPWTSPVHVAIVKRAHAMNVTAQSALLKLLEEPLGPSLFLLCTSNPGSLLDTLRSRTQEARWYSFVLETPSEESETILGAMLSAPLHETLRLIKKVSEDQDRARHVMRDVVTAARGRMLKAAATGDTTTLPRLKILVERAQEGARQLGETNASPLLVLEQIALSVS